MGSDCCGTSSRHPESSQLEGGLAPDKPNTVSKTLSPADGPSEGLSADRPSYVSGLGRDSLIVLQDKVMPGTTDMEMEFNELLSCKDEEVSQVTFAVKNCSESTQQRSIQVENVDDGGVYEYHSDFHTSFEKDDLLGHTRDLLKEIIGKAALKAAELQ